ncbi:hypothetical protein LTR62_002723 [Meristemomyces frigidus]|uniref:BRCT domain-containing protein n=1 Tax=Meristemomyces frigidus TaxID=1508187 RepID=A0AAN7TJB2_9PEZI|nr:hypothetical protein LTR62_002723 [Meristemomyces frigidus]
MPAPCLKNMKITVIFPCHDDQNFTKDKVTRWISNAGGKYLTKFTDTTTHLVCSERTFQAGHSDVRQAHEKVKKGERIYIVSGEWLRVTLMNQKRAKEAEYSFVRVDKAAASVRQKVVQEREAREKGELGEEEEAGPQSVKGLLRHAFVDHTKQFVTEADRKRVEARLQREKAERDEVRKQKEQEERRAKAEQAALFRRGAKKAKNEIFSDNHHIYMDNTGFKYEITLTKIDPSKNRNERYVVTPPKETDAKLTTTKLQLYQSNTEPPTYASNAHFAGTGLVPSNNVIAALGCNYPTALHAFKKLFKEQTGVEWDERVRHAVERGVVEKRRRAGCAGGEGDWDEEGEKRLEVIRRMMEEKEFGKRVFEYHPPVFGGSGLVPEVQGVGLEASGFGLGREVDFLALSGSGGEGETQEGGRWVGGNDGSASLPPSTMPDTCQHQQQHQQQQYQPPPTFDFLRDNNSSALPVEVETNPDFERYACGGFADSSAIEDDDFGLGDTNFPFWDGMQKAAGLEVDGAATAVGSEEVGADKARGDDGDGDGDEEEDQPAAKKTKYDGGEEGEREGARGGARGASG